MTKAVFISVGLAALIMVPAVTSAQDNSSNIAIQSAKAEAVMRQAKVIELRLKLTEAKAVAQRGDTVTAARLYQESC